MTTEAITGFLEHATRILFFTGKGGVGKTSLACAAAVSMAQQGRKVLLVSTDPASNLDEVLGVHLSGAPTAIPGADGLFALHIHPEAAAKADPIWCYSSVPTRRRISMRSWVSTCPARRPRFPAPTDFSR